MGATLIADGRYDLTLTFYGETPWLSLRTCAGLVQHGIVEPSWLAGVGAESLAEGAEIALHSPDGADITIKLSESECSFHMADLNGPVASSPAAGPAQRYFAASRTLAWSATWRYVFHDPTWGGCFQPAWPDIPSPFAGGQGLLGGEAKFDFEGSANGPAFTVSLASAWVAPVSEPSPNALLVAVSYYPGGEPEAVAAQFEELDQVGQTVAGYASSVASRWIERGTQ